MMGMMELSDVVFGVVFVLLSDIGENIDDLM
jgi:hypothetical protein